MIERAKKKLAQVLNMPVPEIDEVIVRRHSGNKMEDFTFEYVAQAMVDFASDDGWISVEDRLPDHQEIVQVSIPDRELGHVVHCVEHSKYSHQKESIWQVIVGNADTTAYVRVYGVTHWREIPKKPKA
jgi:hypothetical protein